MKYKKNKKGPHNQRCRNSFDSQLARQHIVEFWSRRRLDNTPPLPVCWSEASHWFVRSLLDRETKSLLGFFLLLFCNWPPLTFRAQTSEAREPVWRKNILMSTFSLFIHVSEAPLGFHSTPHVTWIIHTFWNLKLFPSFWFGFPVTLTFILIY